MTCNLSRGFGKRPREEGNDDFNVIHICHTVMKLPTDELDVISPRYDIRKVVYDVSLRDLDN